MRVTSRAVFSLSAVGELGWVGQGRPWVLGILEVENNILASTEVHLKFCSR